MFEPFPLGLSGGRRSDRHGVIERHPTLALSRSFLESERYRGARGCGGTQSANTCARTPLNRSSASLIAEQAGPLRRQAIGGCCGRKRESRRKLKRTTKQLHADLAALGLRRLLQSRGGLRSRLEGGPAAGTADVRPRRIRAACVSASAVRTSLSQGSSLGSCVQLVEVAPPQARPVRIWLRNNEVHDLGLKRRSPNSPTKLN